MGRRLLELSPFRARRWGVFVLGAFVCSVLWGCGSSSFVGRQYNNFTAYYNTFYNANQAFEKGLKSIRETDRTVDRRRYLPVFRAPSGQAARSSFEEAVQKSADVLREHPSSKWVDDALLLIGKSYFYQENYVGAAQKFREVLALERGRKAEARFWLARTLTTNGRLAEAAETLRLGEPDEAPENPWTARMYLVRGQLLVRQQQWEEAETALERGLSGDLPDEIAGRGAFLLGQVRETMGAPAEARPAYRRVQDHDPSYELSFAARISEIELQGQHGNAGRALERLRDMKADDKHLENRGEISLVQARVHRALGRPDDAREALRNALYGREEGPSQSGGARGYLHYELATLYRDVYENFDRAAAHLDTASTELSGPGSQRDERQRLPSVPGELEARATQFQNLARQGREVARMDSLLRLGRMDEQQFRSYVDSLRRRRAEERAQQSEDRESRRRRFRGEARTRPEDRERPAPAAQTRSSDAGFLFHQDPTRVQEGQRRFEETWGDRPRVDNWRRRVAMQRAEASDEDADAPTADAAPDEESPRVPEAAGQSSTGGRGAAGLDLSAVPRDSASLSKMEAERAVAQYELANALFLVAGRPDSAATWYRRILQESGDQTVARRALYALGEAYRAQGDTTASRQAFERLVDEHPSTPLARRARQQLGRQLPQPDPARNRAALADSAYAQAYGQWQQGAWWSGLNGLLDVARTYPESGAAPRALLAAGILYWQRLQADSVRPPRSPIVSYLSTVPTRDSTTLDSTAWQAPALEGPVRNDSLWALTASSDSFQTSSRSSRPDSGGTSLAGLGTGSAVGEPLGLPRFRVADSTVGPVPDSVAYRPLRGLLTHLTSRYPDAPQIQRARSMLSLIEQRTAPSDTTAADSLRRDSTGTVPPSDSAAVADTTTDAVPSPPPDSARRAGARRGAPDTARTTSDAPLPAPGGAPPSSRQGEAARRAGWTLLVESFTSSTEASSRADALQQQLGDEWSVRALRDPEAEESPHLLVIGQFGSRGAARQVRTTLENKLSRRLDIRRMPRKP